MTTTQAELCVIKDAYGAIYFEYGDDNSIGCWSTNYLVGGILLGLCMWLVRGHELSQLHPARWSYTAATLSIALSISISGIYHQVCTNPEGCRRPVWALGTIFQGLSGAFLFIGTQRLVTQANQVTKTQKMVYIIFPLFCAVLGGVTSILPFVVGAALFSFLPVITYTSVFLRNLGCPNFCPCPLPAFYDVYKNSKVFLLFISGFLFWLIAALVQVSLGSACSKPCPTDCPLPVPNFNHNALFHILLVPGYVLMALGVDLLVPFAIEDKSPEAATQPQEAAPEV